MPSTSSLISGRQGTARAFYEKTGWPSGRINSHMEGIDFTKPVTVTTLKAGTEVVQYQVPGNPTGNYFAPAGTSPESIGVNPTGRVASTYVTDSDTQVLQSTAASTENNLNLPPSVRGAGGGTQYFTPDPSGLRKLP